MKLTKLALALSALSFCQMAGAAVSVSETAAPWTPFLAIGGGISDAINLGTSNKFPASSSSLEYYNYSAGLQSQTRGLLEVFAGIERPLSPQWLWQVGGAYTQSGQFHPQGTLTQGADISSENNYDYELTLVTRQIMLQTKLMRILHNHFYPYILFGLGAAVNTASNYTSNAPNSLTFTRQYADQTSLSLAYRIGFGMDMDLAKNLRLGIAYRIADLGGFRTGQATINHNAVHGTLSQQALYASEVSAQLTFLI